MKSNYRNIILSVLLGLVLIPNNALCATDTLSIKGIVNYASAISDTNPELATKFLIQLQQRRKFSQADIIQLDIKCSQINLHSGNLRESMHFCIEAMQLAEKSGNYELIGKSNQQMALIYKTLALFLKSAKYFRIAEQNFRKVKDDIDADNAYLYQAHVYTDYGKKNKSTYHLHLAENMYLKVLKQAEIKNNQLMIEISYNNLANLFLVKYHVDSSEMWLKQCNEYAKKAIVLSASLNKPEADGVSFSNYAESFALMHQYDSAKVYYLKSNAIFKSKNAIHHYFYNLKVFVPMLLKNNDLTLAEKVLNECELLIKNHNEQLEHPGFLLLKAQLAAKKGDYKQAYLIRIAYSKETEKMREYEAAREMVRLQFLYDIDKKNKEIQMLNKNERLRQANIRNEKWIRNLLIFGLTLLVATLTVLFFRYREKNRLNKTILSKNKELRRLSIVASNTSNAIAVTDSHGIVSWVNDGFLKLYEWNSLSQIEQELGNNYFNQCGLTRAEINQYVEEIKETRSSVVFQAFRSKRDDEQKFIQTTLTPVFDKSGNLDQLVFIDTDITELLEARETAIREKRKAENALKTQELFLANVSHEIRTPMNGIIGLTRQLSEELTSDNHKEITQSIHVSAENLLHVVNDLLDVSKIRAGKMIIEKTSFSLFKLIENFRTSIEYRAKEKGLKLKIIKDEKLNDAVFGDPIRLNQVLLNLVGNAIKFTMEGEVNISLQVENTENDTQRVNFEISDTGIGIPASKIDSVFDHFTQLEDHRTRTASGTGLGLGISKSLVEAMGGSLTLTSKEGLGTTIHFSLDFEIDHKKGTVFDKTHEVVLHKDLTGLKVLLVEDNSINQKVIVHDLKKWNCSIQVVDDAFEAIERLKNTTFDIILMDYYMPRMDGIETTQYIRSKFPEPVRSIPIIAITASAMRGDNDKFIQAGMNDYISKPFNPEKLYHLLVKWGFNSDSEYNEAVSNGSNDTRQNIDLSLILEKAEGDKEYLNEMYGAYLEMMPVYIKELEDHHKAKNLIELRKSAHQILSPAKLFGLVDAIPILVLLQKDESLSETKIAELVKEVVRQLYDSINFISDKLNKLG